MCSIEEDNDLSSIMREYWKERAESNEGKRFSSKSREAFAFLRKAYKYHEYQVRDSSIIDKVILGCP